MGHENITKGKPQLDFRAEDFKENDNFQPFKKMDGSKSMMAGFKRRPSTIQQDEQGEKENDECESLVEKERKAIEQK